MITFLEGVLVEKSPARAVLNVGGVGYEVFVPLSSFDKLPDLNRTCRVLVYDYIREDQHSLFGFMTEAERQTFTMLMNVNGIGPKLAMSALSGLAASDLVNAIVSGDVARLSSISGIGRKIAERMVLELRDKFASSEMFRGSVAGAPALGQNIKVTDAALALVSLGYKQNEAARMVASFKDNEDLSVEEIVRKALRR